MVDDISCIIFGPFTQVEEILEIMAEYYPHTMPLNVQISFNYSHYLDCHVQNMLKEETINKITLAVAYKELATFAYSPYSSNISYRYKGLYVKSKN